jgi:hypothetical protein
MFQDWAVPFLATKAKAGKRARTSTLDSPRELPNAISSQVPCSAVHLNLEFVTADYPDPQVAPSFKRWIHEAKKERNNFILY